MPPHEPPRLAQGIIVLLVCLLAGLSYPRSAFSEEEPPPLVCGHVYDDPDSMDFEYTQPRIDPTGELRALAVFIRFPDDTDNWYSCTSTGGWPYDASAALPVWADSLLAPYDGSWPPFHEGSLTHYFDQMSGTLYDGRKHWLWGDVYNLLPDSLTGIQDSTYVVEGITRSEASGYGYRSLNYAILEDIDRSNAGFSDTSGEGIDFSLYDTHPRDGWVDMIFMIYKRSEFGVPEWGALAALFDGYSGGIYETNDTVIVDDVPTPVKIDGRNFGSGVTTHDAINKTIVQGVLAHEYLHHVFQDFERPPQSTAGQWHLSFLSHLGIMDDTGGGNAMSAFERARLGWITPQIVSVATTGDTTIFLGDCSSQTGLSKRQAIKIPVRGHPDEYFLLENRQRLSFYDSAHGYLYGTQTEPEIDRPCTMQTLRGPGLYITHVDSLGSGNPATVTDKKYSKHKYVDMESARGLWADPTDPQPEEAQPDSGFYDMLDWIPSPGAARWTSDSLDAFQPGSYFTTATNPHSKAYNQEWISAYGDTGLQDVCTGIRVYTVGQGAEIYVSISFLDDDACSLTTLTDRDTGTSGSQAFMCPAGDADTLSFRMVLLNDCGERVSGYPGTSVYADLSKSASAADTLFWGRSTDCQDIEQLLFSPTDTTNANGEALFAPTVPWIGGHGATGASDMMAILQVAGRDVDSLTIEVRSPDIDGDGVVDIADFALFGLSFGGTGPAEWGDYTYASESGDPVSIIDFGLFASHLHHTCASHLEE